MRLFPHHKNANAKNQGKDVTSFRAFSQLMPGGRQTVEVGQRPC
jgi:hypothetical protein